MREINIPATTLKIYDFNELSEHAQIIALHDHGQNDYPYADDCRASLDAFCEVLGIPTPKFEYGDCRSFIGPAQCSKVLEYMGEEGTTAHQFIEKLSKDDYMGLTGYREDYELCATYCNRIEAGDTFREAVTHAFDAWLDACQVEYDFFYSMEYLKESQVDVEYLADGTRYEGSN